MKKSHYKKIFRNHRIMGNQSDKKYANGYKIRKSLPFDEQLKLNHAKILFEISKYWSFKFFDFYFIDPNENIGERNSNNLYHSNKISQVK